MLSIVGLIVKQYDVKYLPKDHSVIFGDLYDILSMLMVYKGKLSYGGRKIRGRRGEK